MTKQVNVYLSDEQYVKLKKIADADDRNLQYIIRKYIDSLE